MLFIFLMLSTLSVCYGDMRCMLQSYGLCAETSATTSTPRTKSYCVDASKKYRCWEQEARKCDVENTQVIKTLLSDYNEVCLDRGWYNEFKDHEACVYELYDSSRVKDAGPCAYILQEIEEESGLASMCRVLDRTYDCLQRKVKELCGREASYVFCKLLGSRQKLVDVACAEAGVVNNVTLDSSWCMYNGAKAMGGDVVYRLLQVMAAVISLKLLNM